MGAPWTIGDDAEMRRLAAQGLTRQAIAAAMNVSYDRIRWHAWTDNIEVKADPCTYEGSPGVDWVAMRWERLCHCYGPERADLIAAGRDPRTQADIGRWNALGRRSAA